jgi:short-subunit dehydrogenase
VLLVCPGFIRTNVSINALTADGSKQNKMDQGQEQGMAPAVLADKIIDAMKAEKEEVYVGGKEIMGIYLKRFAPRWFSRYMRKVKVT